MSMHIWLHTLYLPLLIIAAGVAFLGVGVAWRLHDAPGGRAFLLMMGGVGVWCLGCVVELLAGGLDGKLLGCQIEYLGIASVPLNWFLLIISYLQHDAWLTRARVWGLWAVPLCTIALIWTNAWHHLMYARVALAPTDALPNWQITYGPWFVVHISYSWLLVLAGLVVILLSLRNIAPVYRRQTLALLAAALLPFLFNILYVLRLGPLPGCDLTPVAFAFSGVGLLLAIRVFRMIEVAPIARNAVFESMRDGVIVLDTRGRVLDTNPALRAILGTESGVLFGADAGALFSAWLPPEVLHETAGMHTVRLTDGEGAVRWFDLRASLLAPRRGRLLVLRDITDLHTLQEQLNMLAYFDAVTGLPNRVLAHDRMKLELARVKRHQTRLAVLFLDVDGFKRVNDTHGHAAGDRLLHEIGRRMLGCVRETDTVARVGGDEFIVVISDLSIPPFAEVTAARILDAFTRPFALDDADVSVTVSIGIAVAPDDDMDADTLLRQADDAMYHVKKHGKNAFAFYREMAEVVGTTEGN